MSVYMVVFCSRQGGLFGIASEGVRFVHSDGEYSIENTPLRTVVCMYICLQGE